MRDKQTPGDTYNYKEHVYADPVALRKEIEKEKQEELAGKVQVKKYQKPTTPPPVPSGPRDGSNMALYAEVQKKSNVPTKVSVRDLGSRFGGALPRAGRGRKETVPPVPEVTESRNMLDESPPGSPVKALNTDSVLAPNISIDEDTARSASVGTSNREGATTGPTVSDSSGKASNEEATPEEDSPVQDSEEQREAPSPVDEAEVVIDVRINSEAGIEIGAELPVASDEDADQDGDGDQGGVRLVRSINHDPFALENSGETTEPKPAPAAAPSDAPSDAPSTTPSTAPPGGAKPEQGSSGNGSGSTGSGSLKRPKKKDVEAGLSSHGHLRRNLILLSLFLLILLILVSAVAVVLVNYSDILG